MKTVLTRSALAALLVAVASTACDSFLTGPGLTEDPNAPTQASRDQVFVGFQAAQFTQFEGALARTACIFVQQCAGVDRQYLSLGEYNFSEDDFSPEFDQVYTGGGLVDIRKVEASAGAGASAAGHQRYRERFQDLPQQYDQREQYLVPVPDRAARRVPQGWQAARGFAGGAGRPSGSTLFRQESVGRIRGQGSRASVRQHHVKYLLRTGDRWLSAGSCLPAAAHDMGREPVDNCRGRLPDRGPDDGAESSERGAHRGRAIHAVGNQRHRAARLHHDREVRRDVPEYRGMERLPAHLHALPRAVHGRGRDGDPGSPVLRI